MSELKPGEHLINNEVVTLTDLASKYSELQKECEQLQAENKALSTALKIVSDYAARLDGTNPDRAVEQNQIEPPEDYDDRHAT